MDIFILSNIADYFSSSKNYHLARELKNKVVSKKLLEKSYKHTGYVCYIDGKKMKTVSIPMLKERTDYPEIDYENMCTKGINNLAFFYNPKEKDIHTFQWLPKKYVKLNVDELIEETCFYEINERSFWVVINHTHIYKFENLKRTKKITLASGFYFEEVLLDDILHSDFFGEEIIIQDLNSEDIYRLKFMQNTYYEIISKDLILIDFSFNEKILDDVLPNNNLELEEKENALFKFTLVRDSPNKIALEFIKFLPKDLKVQKFCPLRGLFWSRNDEEKCIDIYLKDKLLKRIELPDLDTCLSVSKLDEEKLLIEYEQKIGLIEVESAELSMIDMKTRIPDIKFVGSLDKEGDYYTFVMIRDQEELGAWRTYILDQSLYPIYEVTDDRYYLYSD